MRGRFLIKKEMFTGTALLRDDFLEAIGAV